MLHGINCLVAISEQMQRLQTAVYPESSEVLSWYVQGRFDAVVFIDVNGATGCAYRKGLCSICGKQILDTSSYVMSNK
jgi:hypothetical protein